MPEAGAVPTLGKVAKSGFCGSTGPLGAISMQPGLGFCRSDRVRRAGALEEAVKSYQRALASVTNESERRFLQWRITEVQWRANGGSSWNQTVTESVFWFG